MKEFLGRYPLLIPLTALCAGVFQGFFARGIWISCGFFSLLAIYFLRRRSVQAAILVAGLVLIFSLAWIRTQTLSHPALPEVVQQWVARKEKKSVLLKAQTFCQSQGERSYFDADLLGFYQEEEFRAVSARLRWYVHAPQCGVEPGAWYRTRGSFRPIHRYENPSSFDYPAYLTVQGIAGIASIESPQALVAVQGGDSALARWRAKGMGLLAQAELTPLEREAMVGLFWGGRPSEASGLPTLFRDTGLAHLLVVSGFHFTLIFGIFFYLFQSTGLFLSAWAERGWIRKGAMAMAVLPTLIFSYWVGLGPPVLRALVSILLTVLVYCLDGLRDFLSLALLEAFVLLWWWPLYLFDPSFLFSFGAVAALILFSRRWISLFQPMEARGPRLLIQAAGLVLALPLATLVVNGVLYPLMAHYFHRISWVAPLANGLTEPFFSLLLLPGLLAATLLAPLWWQGALALVVFLGKATGWVLQGLTAMAQWGWAATWVGPPRWWIFLPWGMGLILLLIARRWPFFFLALGILASLGLVDRIFSHPTATGRLSLSVLDVGQGDSLLLELPDGSAVLVDGGGIPYSDFDMGEKVVLPELLRRGIRELRAIVMTHPDGDHAFGLVSLARDLKVEEFWTAAPWGSLVEVPELKKILGEKNISIRSLQHGDLLFAAKTSFEVLWPTEESLSDLDLSRNDRSLVLRVCLEKSCLLLTGDLEQRGEQGLLTFGDEITSRVLKVGHHGSRTSTGAEFLQAVNPQLALISAGKDNRFGMPHKEVLARLEQAGIKWFSTERDGQVVIRTDGKEFVTERAARPLH